jgi:GAF domain-containing protein
MSAKKKALQRGDKGGGVKKLASEIYHAVVVGLISRAIIWVGTLALGLIAVIAVLVYTAGSVPAWTAALAVSIVVIVAFCLLVLWARARRSISGVREELEGDLERQATYSGHVRDVLEHLQRVIAGDIKDVTVPEYIQRGLLQPARDVLATDRPEDLRLSVLVPKEDKFTMPLAAGHSLESQQKYELKLKDSLAGVAYESGATQVWDDVTEDPRFKPHPHASRPFRAMVACPLRVGDQVSAVFNVISDEVAAFGPAEVTYIEALGSVINVARGVDIKDRKVDGQDTASSG